MQYSTQLRLLVERIFPAKILLFGEHILLKGATALAAPATAFSGKWQRSTTLPHPIQWEQLKAVYDRLDPALPFDFQQLKSDINDGWHFQSSIPQGYGLGSSGALCAALYDRYGLSPRLQSPEALKQLLGQIESSFHGKSSGIDPLTSYLSAPLLIQRTHNVHLVPDYTPPGEVSVFLVDTHQPRQTGVLVQWFLEQYEQDGFRAKVDTQLMPLHEQMVQSWLSGNGAEFMERIQQVSHWQQQWLLPMLPTDPRLKNWWQAGLDSDDMRLKICGAGGGGFVLGFTTRKEAVVDYAQQAGIQLIFPFELTTNA